MNNAQIFHGDCLDVLKNFESNSIDSIVTDPPYGLSFMGKKWDYDVPSVDIWMECLRVLKPGGHLLAFAGTRTQHRMAVRIEDAGFEIRDMIAWVYGSGFPKSHNLDGEWKGWGTALKPALEPITMARKPLIGTVAANVAAHGTGALNIEDCRIGLESTRRTCNGIGRSLSFDLAASGTARVNGSDSGRWPANLIHDGSDEVIAGFPETKKAGNIKESSITAGSSVFGIGGLGKRNPAIAGDNGGYAARFFYCAKASKKDRDDGLEEFEKKSLPTLGGANREGNIDPVSERFRTPSRANTHPTVKPTDLMRYLCRLVTPPSGTVMDPFMGSGSTGKAAVAEGFKFIGIERDEEYVKISKARIGSAVINS